MRRPEQAPCPLLWPHLLPQIRPVKQAAAAGPTTRSRPRPGKAVCTAVPSPASLLVRLRVLHSSPPWPSFWGGATVVTVPRNWKTKEHQQSRRLATISLAVRGRTSSRRIYPPNHSRRRANYFMRCLHIRAPSSTIFTSNSS